MPRYMPTSSTGLLSPLVKIHWSVLFGLRGAGRVSRVRTSVDLRDEEEEKGGTELVVGFDDAVDDGDRGSRDLVDGDVAVSEWGGPGHGQEEEVSALSGGNGVSHRC